MEDLFVEFLEDLFLSSEDYAREKRLEHLGMEIAPTGDPLIDMWERQLAQGQTPDLDAGEDDRAKQRDALIRSAAARQRATGGPLIYKAKLHPAIAYMEAIRQGNEPEVWGQSESSPGGAEAGLFEESGGDTVGMSSFSNSVHHMVETIPREAFDAFVSAAGLLKK